MSFIRKWLAAIAILGLTIFAWHTSNATFISAVTAPQITPAELKIAFIGDGGLGPDSIAVLNLIKSEGAQAILHSGDLEYTDNPAVWEAQINGVLGPDFPYFVTIGNHDELAWRGPGGYQQYLINRFNRLGIIWNGDLGVQSSFHYRGLFFVNAAPGISSGFDTGNSAAYIKEQLASDNSVWSICSWHKNMKRMQVGGKVDETGWAVYEEAKNGGAIIATAHEHSYSRTHLLASMMNQTILSTANTLTLSRGNSFAFVSGLGGNSVRPQLLSGDWWASISASTCLAGDPVCQPDAKFGALFGVFNVHNEPNRAFFYFKDVSGRIVDTFTVVSEVELPGIETLSPSSARAGGNDFVLTVGGQNFVDGSVVRWNGSNRPTTFVSSTKLNATLAAADIAAAGTALVTVSGSTGVSNSAVFTVDPPLPPFITTLQPVTTEAGGNGFTLIVNGNRFVNSSVVRWNSSNRPTTFVSPNQLTAAISSTDIEFAGSATVTVSNPTGSSNTAAFTIAPPSLILFTDTNSERAIALDALTLIRDPFLRSAPNNFSSDGHTRIMIFSPNLLLLPGDNFVNLTAQAEDAQHRLYPLTVEFVGNTPTYDWLKQIVIRLPDQVAGIDTLWLKISYGRAISNRAMISLK